MCIGVLTTRLVVGLASAGALRSRAMRVACAGVVVAGVAGLPACEKKTPATPTVPAAGNASAPGGKPAVRVSDLVPPSATPDATYVVRGEVMSLPLAGRPGTELNVKHEAIDDFKNREGKEVGMSAMVMEFPPAKGVDVSELNVGDKVKVSFSVWWTQTPPWVATKIERLPPETELEFRKKKPRG